MNRLMRGLLIFVLALVAVVPAFAQEAAGVTFELGADGLIVPPELPAGIANVSFVNSTDAPYAPLVARLNEGVTTDALMEALAQGPEASLPLVSLLGGTQIGPQSSFNATFDLKPGTHVVLNFAGESAPQLFTVAEGNVSAETAPEADVTVSLLDFAFSLPTTISAGEQTWALENKGEQWHEMGIYRIDDSTTIAELRDIMQQMVSSDAAAELPVEQVGFWMPLQQHERAWFNINLDAGTYVVVCFLPDFASGHAHMNLGMVQLLTVTE